MITTNMHNVARVNVTGHRQSDRTEWATFVVSFYDGSEQTFTVFENGAICDVMQLPKSKDFKSDFASEPVRETMKGKNQ